MDFMTFLISSLSMIPELSKSYILNAHISLSSAVLAATRSTASRNSLKSKYPLLSESRVLDKKKKDMPRLLSEI